MIFREKNIYCIWCFVLQKQTKKKTNWVDLKNKKKESVVGKNYKYSSRGGIGQLYFTSIRIIIIILEEIMKKEKSNRVDLEKNVMRKNCRYNLRVGIYGFILWVFGL